MTGQVEKTCCEQSRLERHNIHSKHDVQCRTKASRPTHKLSPANSEALKQTPGMADEAARLAEQLKVDSARSCEALRAAKEKELLFL
jgi:hypothetical protein